MVKTANILQNRPKSVRIAFFLAYVVFVYLLILYIVQRDLIFYPSRDYISPHRLGLTVFQETRIKAFDGERIMTWFAPGEKNKPAILFFHENSGQLAQFAPQLLPLIDQGYSVLMMEYRGFGNTSGTLREKDVFADAEGAFDFLQARGYRHIIAMGYSFGTAPAIALANTRPIGGLILLAPFTSMEQLVADSWFPFARYILEDTYHSDTRIRFIKVPLLIVHGVQDTLIPYFHAEQMHQLAGTQDKHLSLLPYGTHASLYFSEQFIPEVLDWLNR